MADNKLVQIGGLRTKISEKTGEKFYVGSIKHKGEYVNFIIFKNKYKQQQIDEGTYKVINDFNIFLSNPPVNPNTTNAAPKPAAKPAPKVEAPKEEVPTDDALLS